MSISSEDVLTSFLEEESHIHYENYLKAGREQGLPFQKTYANMKKLAGRNGLCNSEVALSAALWGAKSLDCDVEYIPLTSVFITNEHHNGYLLDRVQTADALLMSTPVYFGDRSSLCNDFINLLKSCSSYKHAVSGKPVGGVSVGAKRNGGQETSLIYQLQDFLSLGMLGLGNDHETTSQYGGTVVAGDIGTAVRDDYGLQTSIGTGRRLARLAIQLAKGESFKINGKLRVTFILLQDKKDKALQMLEKLIEEQSNVIEAKVINVCTKNFERCMACDICPYKVGSDLEYRCTVQKATDSLATIHPELIGQDMLIPVVYSPLSRDGFISQYQRFLERTRYIRRGDYSLSDVAIQPLVFEDIGASEHMSSRMITSLIRHHTVMLKPIIGYLYDGRLINSKQVLTSWQKNIDHALRIVKGKLASIELKLHSIVYKPVGYHLSTAKDKELLLQDRQEIVIGDRLKRLELEASQRLMKK